MKAVKYIKECLKNRAEIVSYEDRNIAGILVVAGCSIACVDVKPFEKQPMWVVTSEQDVESFIEKIIEVENVNGLERDIQK